jgi:hypothetical protein
MDDGTDGEGAPADGVSGDGVRSERLATTPGDEVDQLRRELGAAKADIGVKDEYIAVLEADLDEARRALAARPSHRLAEQAKSGLRRLRRAAGR